jgi:hypothetical protein
MVLFAAVAEFITINRMNKKHILNACRVKANEPPWDFSFAARVVGIISLVAALLGTILWGYGDLLIGTSLPHPANTLRAGYAGGQVDLDYWKLTTFVIAAFAAYIAYQQYRLGREKFKLDLFEKRFSVFAGARRFLTHILKDGDLKTLDPVWEYRAAIGEASFLFEEDIVEYLEEIYRRALKLHSDRETMQPLPAGDDRKRLAHDISESLGWLTGQLPELKNRFAPYMKFKTWT